MRMPIPSDWDGLAWCRWAICWPDSVQWRAILTGFVTYPSRGFFWDETTGNLKDVLTIGREINSNNLPFMEVIMACGDANIADALNAIAVAIASNGHSGGGNGGSCNNCYNTTNVDVQDYVTLEGGQNWPIYGTAPIPELTPGAFPDGYEDLPEYDADKCAKATKMVEDWIDTLFNMGSLNWGVGVIGAAVIIGCLVGAITVPPAVIPLLLFALTGTEFISANCIALSNYISDNKQEFICALYEGENIQGIIGAIGVLIDAAVASLGIEGLLAVVVKNIALWLMNADTLSPLFTSADRSLYPEAECDTCGVGWTTLYGNLVSGELAGDFVMESVLFSPGGVDRQIIFVYAPNDGICRQVTIGTDGWSEPPSGTGSAYINCSGEFGPPGPLGNGIITDPAGTFIDICVRYAEGYITLQSSTPFTASFTMGEIPCE